MPSPKETDCEFYFPPIPDTVVCYELGDEDNLIGAGSTKSSAYANLVLQHILREDEGLKADIAVSEFRAERKLEGNDGDS